MWQIGLARIRFQHDRPACQRVDAISQRQCFVDQLLDQQHRGSALTQLLYHVQHAIQQNWR
jgi:hypothetical protein